VPSAFTSAGPGGPRTAAPGGPAAGRPDRASPSGDDLLADPLAAGVRRTEALDAVLARGL
jgi:hypothetical protein